MLLRILICSALLLAIPLPAQAILVLDQDTFTVGSNGSGGFSEDNSFGRAQTFTVGQAGILNSIDIMVDFSSPPHPTSAMRILATSGGAPIGGSAGSIVLATSNATSYLGGNIYHFDFTASALNLTAGDVLAIEPLDGTGSSQWAWSTTPYSGGSDYNFNTKYGRDTWTLNPIPDWMFRTFVDVSGPAVPEPSTFVLAALGLLGLGLFGRRRLPQRVQRESSSAEAAKDQTAFFKQSN